LSRGGRFSCKSFSFKEVGVDLKIHEILDDVTLAAGPCPCGRGLPLLTRIDGRRHPLLHLPGGARKAISGLYLEIRKVGGITCSTAR
jgi:hypothetical protein